MEKSGYVDIDSLQAQTSLDEAARLCGVTLDARGQGKEMRIDCPFGCGGDHCGRKEVAINTDNPQKVFMCHAYACKFRGNLLTLMHGWLTGGKPESGKMVGSDFQRVKKLLIKGVAAPSSSPHAGKPVDAEHSPPSEPDCNIPLIDSLEEKVREIHNIDQKLIVEVGGMNPAAAAYVRRHSCLSPESMKKWRCGYLPNDGGGDKRGWSLRGQMIYPVLSEEGKVLSWVGRDPSYEQKEQEFALLNEEGRKQKAAPAKHRFPKGFQRGLELFGQQASRLSEPGYREVIALHGIIVVEGFNDVIGLDNLGIPAVGLCSNRMTESQGTKITRWAQRLADGKVTLFLDCDSAGDEGAKEALWMLVQQGVRPQLAWSTKMLEGAYAGSQPESLTHDEVMSLLNRGKKNPR